MDLHKLVVASGLPAMLPYTTLQRWVFSPKVDHHALLVSLRLLFLLKSPNLHTGSKAGVQNNAELFS